MVTNIEKYARNIEYLSDEVYQDILNQRKCLFDKYAKQFETKLNLEFHVGCDTREFELYPAVATVIADELLENGFSNVTPQDALILYFGVCAYVFKNKNLCMPLTRKYIKNTLSDSDKPTKEDIDEVLEISNNIKSVFGKRYRCGYTDPHAKWGAFKLYNYYHNCFIYALFRYRLDGNTDNFMPDFLDLPNDGCLYGL
jgi:hypothetical protein